MIIYRVVYELKTFLFNNKAFLSYKYLIVEKFMFYVK